MSETAMHSQRDKSSFKPQGSEADKQATHAQGTRRWQEAAARSKTRQLSAGDAQQAFHEDLSGFIAEVESLLGQGTSLSAEALAASRAQISERLAGVKTQLVELGEEAGQGTEQMVDAARGYVRERPLQSVGIALGLGLAVGYLLHRR